MKQVLLAIILFVPLICHAKMISFTGDHDWHYFDSNYNPTPKAGQSFSLTIDDSDPLSIFDLSLTVDGMTYRLDKSMGISYYHELPSTVGASMPVLNATGYLSDSVGQTGFEWSLHLEFSMIEPNTSFAVTDRSLENFFSFETMNNTYFGAPFFHKVPEPSSLVLIALGLIGLSIRQKK